MLVIVLLMTVINQVIGAHVSNDNCTDVDDKIMMRAVFTFQNFQKQHCSSKDTPYNDSWLMGTIENNTERSLNCSIHNLTAIVRHYYENFIDCTDYFDEWFLNIGIYTIFSKNMCKFIAFNRFHNLKLFINYLINQSISYENYTRMIISAQCKLSGVIGEVSAAQNNFKKKRNEFVKYLIRVRNETNITGLNDSDLIEKLKEYPAIKNLSLDRYFLKILICHIRNDNFDKLVETQSKLHDQISPFIHLSHKVEDYLFFIGGLAAGMVILALTNKKRGIFGSKASIKLPANDIHYDVGNDHISGL
ncbi:hypothetical protein RF11_09173 [Thelohanellus kitauei]|uniref:Uncharacterized protein n=1 Tax=Thelohanellus kitauei TaxID=669202 RepID=A0A0C2J054_THEKT|nr:hypothetical protein RF11_09173 [Thelohanellus kitauei]